MKNFKKLWKSVAIGLGAGLLSAVLGANVGVTIALIVFGSLIAWFAFRDKKEGGTFKHDGF